MVNSQACLGNDPAAMSENKAFDQALRMLRKELLNRSLILSSVDDLAQRFDRVDCHRVPGNSEPLVRLSPASHAHTLIAWPCRGGSLAYGKLSARPEIVAV